MLATPNFSKLLQIKMLIKKLYEFEHKKLFCCLFLTGSKTSHEDPGISNPGSAELSPISQTSPISMSPLTPGGSPLSSGVNSPVAANAILRETRTSSLAMKIHSRRFRE